MVAPWVRYSEQNWGLLTVCGESRTEFSSMGHLREPLSDGFNSYCAKNKQTTNKQTENRGKEIPDVKDD